MAWAYLALAAGLPILFSLLIIMAPWRFAIPLATFILFTATALGFTFFNAPWSYFSYWLFLAVAVLTVGAVFFGLAKLRTRSWAFPGIARSFASAGFALGAIFFGSYLADAVNAMQPPEDLVALDFPMKNGMYAIVQGGSGAPLQLPQGHGSSPSQRYALDVVKLNRGGHAFARWMDPDAPGTTRGEPVHAPCAGEVVQARDGLPDGRERDLKRPAGNVVTIDCDGTLVSLAHFAEGSLTVQQGQTVAAGTKLGVIGTSGSSAIAHLHFHAERGAFRGDVSDNPGVAMAFDDRFLWTGALFSRPL